MGKSSLKRLFTNYITSGVQMVTNKVACSIAVDVAKQVLGNLPCLPVRVKTVRRKIRLDLCCSWDFTLPIMVVSYRRFGTT